MSFISAGKNPVSSDIQQEITQSSKNQAIFISNLSRKIWGKYTANRK